MPHSQVNRDEIDILYDTLHHIARASSSRELLLAASHYAQENGAISCVLFYVNYTPRLHWELVETWIGAGGFSAEVGDVFYPEHQAMIGVLEKQPDQLILLPNIDKDPFIDEISRNTYRMYEMKASAVLPLWNRGQWIGTLMFNWNKPYRFSERDQRIYTALIQQAAPIIDSIRAYLAEEEARKESELLYRISEGINAAMTYHEVVQAVAKVDTESQAVYLSVWDNHDGDASDEFEVLGVLRQGDNDSILTPGRRFTRQMFPLTDLMRGSAVWVFEDIEGDSRVDPSSKLMLQLMGTRAMIATDLYYHDRWLGGLAFHDSKPRCYAQSQLRLTMGIGELVSAALERIRLQQLTENSRRRAETLAAMNAALSQANSEDEILAAIAAVAEPYGVQMATLSYSQIQENGLIDRVIPITMRGLELSDKTEKTLRKVPYKFADYPLLNLAYHQPHAPIFIENIHTDERPEVRAGLDEARSFGSSALIIFPLQVGDTWQGVVFIAWQEPQRFSEEIRTLFTAVQPAVAAVVARRRAYLAERQRAHQLETVAKVSAAAASILDVDELLDAVAELMRINFENYQMSIFLIDPNGNYLLSTAPTYSPRATRPFQVISLNDDHSPIAKAARTKQGVIANDPGHLSQVSIQPHAAKVQSEIAVPMVVNEQLIGVLDVQSDEEQYFTSSDIWVMATLADLIAVALQNARLYTQAQELAIVEERSRLAHELHDSVSQALYGIALGTRTARMLLDQDPTRVAEPLDYVLSLADGGLSEMRALIFDLRPESLEEEGLLVALNKQADVLRNRHNIEVDLQFEESIRLKIEAEETLYRIAREALHNVIKHAQATHVYIKVECVTTSIIMEITDNGRGFDLTHSFPGHLGLHSMRERALRSRGIFDVKSAVGRGTTLRVTLPPDCLR
ncbi:MAG: GAF domain-containing sensor histidine kinase [Chloroflexi bacterium]|nr:GAF domain-containing sensor histidine kinase [Chloroflexota bacterium]